MRWDDENRMQCDYCGLNIKKPMRVGKILVYCNSNCFAADCLKRYPGTSLAAIVTRMFPAVMRRGMNDDYTERLASDSEC